MFKKYDVIIKKILSEKPTDINWGNILHNHQRMVSRIQHERLIHLLVTIFVGLIMSISVFVTIITKETYLLFFCVPLSILFVAYIFHYRFLENTTQEWYLLEDEIKKRMLSMSVMNQSILIVSKYYNV